MRQITFLCIAACLMSMQPTVAQTGRTFGDVIGDLRAKCQSSESMKIKMTIAAYTSRGGTDPFYTENVLLKKNGTNYRYHLSATEMVMNDRCMVVVDHSARQISISERDLIGEKKLQNNLILNLDSVIRYDANATYEGLADGSEKFVITHPAGDINSIELFINQKSGNLDKVNYAYRTGQWVTICFNEFDLSPVFATDEFDERLFVLKTQAYWKPSVSLQGYRIVRANR